MVNSLSKGILFINKMLSSIDRRTANTIKNIFFLMIFFMMIFGAITGYRLGRDDAKIKSAPIINSTNEAFRLDIKRERLKGDFSSLLDSETISETEHREMKKADFPLRESLNPENYEGIIELEKDRKIRTTPGTDARESLIEGEYRPYSTAEPDVKPLQKNYNESKKSESSPLIKEDLDIQNRSKDIDRINTDEKMRSPNLDEPGLIENDRGIIEN